MTITREMIRTAERAVASRCCDPAGIRSFLLSRHHPEGGFPGRGKSRELYYTQFALMSCRALGLEGPLAKAGNYLRSFSNIESLSLVDLCSLARCLALAKPVIPDATRTAIIDRIQDFRAGTGGFAAAAGEEHGTMYGCFMAMGALQDLEADCSAVNIGECIDSLQLEGGGYANDAKTAVPTTPTTAAAIVLMLRLGREVPGQTSAWLADRICPDGGFAAATFSPSADLLSTAVSLLALRLSGSGLPPENAEACLRYALSLLRENGGFAGSLDDPEADVEYTFYGLLAIGSLVQTHGQ